METKQTHTPGPWRSYKGDGRCWIVATTTTMAYGATGLLADGDLEADEANAHLIAAAPEMLEALQLALISVQEAQRTFATTEDVMWCNAEEVIKAAIRKARGEL